MNGCLALYGRTTHLGLTAMKGYASADSTIWLPWDIYLGDKHGRYMYHDTSLMIVCGNIREYIPSGSQELQRLLSSHLKTLASPQNQQVF